MTYPVPREPCPAYLPDDWSLMRQRVYDWARSVAIPAGAAAIVWGRQNAPEPDRPFVRLNILTPPVEEGEDDEFNVGTALKVLTAVENEDYLFTINGTNVLINSGSPTTVEDIRDALVVEAGTVGEPITASAVGTDVLQVSPNVRTPDPVVATDDPNLALKVAHMALGNRIVTFSVDVIGRPPDIDDPDPVGNADRSLRISSALQNSLRAPLARELLFEGGWAFVDVEGERKPDERDGALWSDRAGFDVRLRCRSRYVEVNDYLERLTDEGLVGEFT